MIAYIFELVTGFPCTNLAEATEFLFTLFLGGCAFIACLIIFYLKLKWWK